MEWLKEITKALADLDEDKVLQLVRDALNNDVSGDQVLKACQDGMNLVGERFECQDYFVSDLIMSGEIFKQIGVILEPHLKAGGQV